jgi:regulator of replication initiation timing
MSDATLNEEIACLEIEIDAVRDALDEAIKRNEALEEENKRLKAVLEDISDNGGDTLTIENAVRIADAALASSEPKP